MSPRGRIWLSLALVVPGRSEQEFLRPVLARWRPGVVGQIVDARGDTKVSAEAGALRRALVAKGHGEVVFLRDLDEFPGCTLLLREFPPEIHRRDIVIARRCLEAWYLADAEALQRLFSRALPSVRVPADVDELQRPQATLSDLFQRQWPGRGVSYAKTEFARKIGGVYDPERAAQRSASLRRLLARIDAAVGRNR